MSYRPNENELDFEIGILGGLKKVAKGAVKGLKKVTDVTIVKPSEMIGGAIGGKKGAKIGRSLGKITEKATLLGTGAAAAGVAVPVLGAAAPGLAGAALMKKKRKKGNKGKAERDEQEAHSEKGGFGGVLNKMRHPAERAAMAVKKAKASRKSSDNALAAKVAADLVGKLGGPLAEANKALKLAELQRTATYEHTKLMKDADFRKKVLAGIASLAAHGDEGCQRTIKVIVDRG